jgi:hypothetical protein
MTLQHAASLRPALLTTFALLAIAGCDPAPVPDMELGGDDMADAGDDAQDEGDEPPAGDDDGDGGSPTDDDGFDDTPAEAFGALDGMMFTCSEAQDAYVQVVFDADALEVRDRDGVPMATGTYTVTDDSVTISVPALGFEESSVAHEIELGVVATFTTPSLFCHAIALDVSPDATSTITKCPDIRYISGTSYEHHELHFWTDGSVKRRGWVELLDINDTLYSEAWGIYLQVGDRVFMFFGDAKEERLLTGTVGDSGVLVDQWEPEAGPCA